MLINLTCLKILKFTEKAGEKVSVEAHFLIFVVGSCTVVFCLFFNHSNIYRGYYRVA